MRDYCAKLFIAPEKHLGGTPRFIDMQPDHVTSDGDVVCSLAAVEIAGNVRLTMLIIPGAAIDELVKMRINLDSYDSPIVRGMTLGARNDS